MSYIFRDFDIQRERLGNIKVSFVELGIICVIVFGLYCDYRCIPVRVKYPENMDLYKACKVILDKITKDFRPITYEGYVECIHIEDRGLLSSKLEFIEENIKYLTTYPNHEGFDGYTKIVEGEITEDRKFDYDFKALLQYNLVVKS
jgi:hypothetical protein